MRGRSSREAEVVANGLEAVHHVLVARQHAERHAPHQHAVGDGEEVVDRHQHEHGGRPAVDDAHRLDPAHEVDEVVQVAVVQVDVLLGQAGDGQDQERERHHRVLDAVGDGEAIVGARGLEGGRGCSCGVSAVPALEMAAPVEPPPQEVGRDEEGHAAHHAGDQDLVGEARPVDERARGRGSGCSG